MTVGSYYRVTFTITRTSGSVTVILGAGGDATSSSAIDTTGTYSIDLYFGDVGTDSLSFLATDDFDGEITDITLKEITYACWTPSLAWSLSSDGACKTDDTIGGNLEESVAAYTTVNGYYSLSFTISNYASGSLVAYVAGVTDQDSTTIEANGDYTLYFEPGASGVVKFTPTADFVGCISAPDLRELRNDYLIQIVDPSSETDLYTIPATYYHQWVTFDYDIDAETTAQDGVGLQYGCYNLYIYDRCLTTGVELVTNGNFSDGFNDWSFASYSNTANVVANQLEVTFDPTTTADLATNGDFSSGGANWTVGAGWAIAGGATHTPGTTNALSQLVSFPDLSPTIWIQFTISGRTAGGVRVSIGSNNSPYFSVNGTITTLVSYTSGADPETVSFTPNSAFDGTIDDIKIYQHAYLLGTCYIYQTVGNPLITSANYRSEVELISVPNADVRGVAPSIGGVSTSYDNTIGTVIYDQNNYVPGSNIPVVGFSFASDTIPGQYYPGTIVIDNVSTYRLAPFEATYVSECFQYRESLANSKAFVGYCDTPSFGYEFTNSGFKFFERLVCRSFAPTYEKDKKVYNYGSGSSWIYYSEMTKWQGVYLDAVSETVHDTMSIIIDCDHFQIGEDESNVVEYVAKPDDYTPEWDRSGLHALATVRFDVKTKSEGTVYNRDC
jgi:hypothetical protein